MKSEKGKSYKSMEKTLVCRSKYQNGYFCDDCNFWGDSQSTMLTHVVELAHTFGFD